MNIHNSTYAYFQKLAYPRLLNSADLKGISIILFLALQRAPWDSFLGLKVMLSDEESRREWEKSFIFYLNIK